MRLGICFLTSREILCFFIFLILLSNCWLYAPVVFGQLYSHIALKTALLFLAFYYFLQLRFQCHQSPAFALKHWQWQLFQPGPNISLLISRATRLNILTKGCFTAM